MTNRLNGGFGDNGREVGAFGRLLQLAQNAEYRTANVSDLTTIAVGADGMPFADALRSVAQVDDSNEDPESFDEADDALLSEEPEDDPRNFGYRPGARAQRMDASGKGPSLEDLRFERGRRPKKTDRQAISGGAE